MTSTGADVRKSATIDATRRDATMATDDDTRQTEDNTATTTT